MFLKTEIKETEYQRLSKLKKVYTFIRKKTVAIFKCDSCESLFERDLKHVDRKRLSNNYFHCCPNCDAKRFAQRKGVEQKKIWDLPASTNLPIDKY